MLVTPRRRALAWPAWLLVLVVAASILTIFAASRPSHASAQESDYVVVKHTFYLSDDGSLAMDEEESGVSAQYVVNAHRWTAASLPVTVRYNSAGQPADFGMPTVIQNALNTWNAVTPSTFSFAWGGTGSGAVGACGNSINLDGQNTIKFEALPGVTLGQTCTVWNVGEGSNAKLVEFDMQLDSDPTTWSASDPPQAGRYDLPSTVLHELGHAAGLGHSGDASAVMYPTLKSGVAKRALTGDDTSGLLAAYPGGGPTPSPSPSPSPTQATPTATPTLPLPPTLPRARTMALARD